MSKGTIGIGGFQSSLSSQKTEVTAPDSANTSISNQNRLRAMTHGSLSKTILTPTSEVNTKRNQEIEQKLDNTFV